MQQRYDRDYRTERYGRERKKTNQVHLALAVVFGLLSFVLFILVLYLGYANADKSDTLADKTVTIDDLRQENLDLKADNSLMERKLLLAGKQGGGRYHRADDTNGSATTHSAEYWRKRCKRLERELSAAEKSAHYYKVRVPKDVRESMERKKDVSVGEIKIEPSGDGLQALLEVINRASVTMNNISGNLRLWDGYEIAHEEPFLVRKIPAQSTITLEINLPETKYTHFSGHVRAGKLYE